MQGLASKEPQDKPRCIHCLFLGHLCKSKQKPKNTVGQNTVVPSRGTLDGVPTDDLEMHRGFNQVALQACAKFAKKSSLKRFASYNLKAHDAFAATRQNHRQQPVGRIGA